MNSGSRLAAYAACGLFAGLGLLFFGYPGAQYDEVFFYNALHGRGVVEYAMKFGPVSVPIMLVTYAGTLKAALYAPLLHWFGASDATLRLPAIAFGALSVGLFFLVMRRLAGPRAAALVALVLATDAVYLLTCVFDWGPVALQHLLSGGALYCLVRFAQERADRWLFAGTLLAGLALWNKALFAWHLMGFGLALLIIFRRGALLRTRRQWAAALLGFVLGAAPLLYYNKIHRLRTFRSNVRVGSLEVDAKLSAMNHTLDGSALFGYLVREEPAGPVQDLKRWEQIPLALSDALGAPRRSVQQWLLWAAILLSPVVCWFGPLRRLALFFWLGGVLTYAQMFLTKGAGGSAHHTILMWPAPQILLGLLLAETARRWPQRGLLAGIAVVAVCVAGNVAVLNTYLARFIACGPGPVWTEAIRPLVRELARRPERTVFAVDWGITQQLEFYGQGGLGLRRNSDGVVDNLPQPAAVATLEQGLADSANLFVMHAEGYETFAGVRRRLISFAAHRGYRDVLLRTIPDRHGVVIFELHEFRK
ncbi:MAG: glycosyltransferase family 39 protein [Bryobacterales bacterium]|nr:glycosyltransferase family 39 protein [Bryobacterales bacterium]